MRPVAFALIGLAAASAAASAQTVANTNWPPAGTRVRVQSPVLGVERQVGTIESVAGDTLHFRRAGDGASASLTSADITRIDVSGGTHTSKAKWGAIGFLAGAAVGAAIGGATYKQCKDSFECIGDIGGKSGSVALGAIAGGLIGGIAGALLGTPHRETWKPVSH